MSKQPHGRGADNPVPSASPKPGLHPANPHRSRYDFDQLIAQHPPLGDFVEINAFGDASIDFADPDAVRALNRALLKQSYGITGWVLPPQYLCPPIPGRADYLLHAAELLAECNDGVIPCGDMISVLDLGVGANCIYPLIGHAEFGWRFVGSDIDRDALACAQQTLDANPGFGDAIELRLQPFDSVLFRNVLGHRDWFELVVCNPPFHASPAEARAGSTRKWKNLGRAGDEGAAPVLNFSGQAGELYCHGGESGIVRRMVAQSADYRFRCLWFTTLVSKSSNLPAIYRALDRARVADYRTVEMAQGQKKSRFVAWTFFDAEGRRAWRNGERRED
ncbi:23S rRNA (adenine(1618)-N(6))-methyltransferase RlmF [Niveibacterium sp. 24ML]|uniref:23S rRNA (adenine(1618)-N(6))-methyltransferase RlmF n=1 Tax=Niveibacterium sp. 24ML TaxID=2985512 RepID=UPI002271CF5D|nr:23S rRNA (adenine(1618)-N(6))-methyltransferase RlmF [Niveibacterium sp. 24ML]MCX9156674.1 23S rRNA (adenine(1618)-N(6))-methyltransferase RlmF [Niveibacterium sp. 24ML]